MWSWGTDQKFNVATGRDLQRHFDKGTQFGLLLPILVGLDGVQKMSRASSVVGLEEDRSMYPSWRVGTRRSTIT